MKTQTKSAATQLIELVVIVATALGLAFGIQAFLVKPYRIPSGSMEPTLKIGQRVLVNRLDEEPHLNPSTKTMEFSLRDPDGYYVTISALSQLSSSGGPGPVEEVWQGRVNVTLLGATDDRASAAEVGKVFDPQMYWNPIAGF